MSLLFSEVRNFRTLHVLSIISAILFQPAVQFTIMQRGVTRSLGLTGLRAWRQLRWDSEKITFPALSPTMEEGRIAQVVLVILLPRPTNYGRGNHCPGRVIRTNVEQTILTHIVPVVSGRKRLEMLSSPVKSLPVSRRTRQH